MNWLHLEKKGTALAELSFYLQSTNDWSAAISQDGLHELMDLLEQYRVMLVSHVSICVQGPPVCRDTRAEAAEAQEHHDFLRFLA